MSRKELGWRGWLVAGGAAGTERGSWVRLQGPGTDTVDGMGARVRGDIWGDLDFELGATDQSKEGVGRRCGFAGRDNELGFGTSWVGAINLWEREGACSAGSVPAMLPLNIPLIGLEIHANPRVEP